MSETEAIVFVDVDFTVVGTLLKGYPETGPSYASGGEPGQDDCMEDIRITDMRFADLPSWFEGVNMKSPDVHRLLTNMLQTIADAAHEALLEAAVLNEDW